MKMWSNKNAWFINDKGVVKTFKHSIDAWMYVLMMKEVRPHTPQVPRSLYPVKSLDPMPSLKVKKVTVNV